MIRLFRVILPILFLCCLTGCEGTALEQRIKQSLAKKRNSPTAGAISPASLKTESPRGKRNEKASPEREIRYNVICPPGTKPGGKPPPLGNEEWCVRGDSFSGVKHGPAITWVDGDSKKMEAYYVDGKLSGAVKSYSATGELIEVKTYRDGEPNGRWIKWNSSGQKELDGFIRGQIKLGHWTQYDRNGSKNSEGNYDNGKKVGVWTQFYPSGKPREKVTFKDGRKDGKFFVYAEAGYPLEQGSFKDDKRNGLWRFSNNSGAPKEQGSYDLGKKVGVWTSFDLYGRPGKTRNHGGQYQEYETADSGNGFKEM